MQQGRLHSRAHQPAGIFPDLNKKTLILDSAFFLCLAVTFPPTHKSLSLALVPHVAECNMARIAVWGLPRCNQVRSEVDFLVVNDIQINYC